MQCVTGVRLVIRPGPATAPEAASIVSQPASWHGPAARLVSRPHEESHQAFVSLQKTCLQGLERKRRQSLGIKKELGGGGGGVGGR